MSRADALHYKTDLLDHELPQDKRELIIQMHLELDDNLPLVKAYAIADEVERKIKEAVPSADVVIHQVPISSVNTDALPLFKRAP
ncbi:hypothetical protein Tel_06415 [Candidatus Tenderia electrophaga]|uniref:Cation efflux protein cytoplasmic domain-containing protein n=1 Tax=Candidatus Tenderia electrophaga TaxID=1748243 RepID=A0A0S2TCC1_9GAMM|nr:hypothetical protein Tel_06415 [Candidatus Tenderia electrophaga]